MKMAFFNVMSNTSEHILLTVSGTFLVPLSYNIRRGDHLVQQGFQQGVESGNNFHPRLLLSESDTRKIPETVSKICSGVFYMTLKTGTFIFGPNSHEPGCVKSLEHKVFNFISFYNTIRK